MRTRVILRVLCFFVLVASTLGVMPAEKASSAAGIPGTLPNWIDGTPILFDKYRDEILNTPIRSLTTAELQAAGRLTPSGVVAEPPVGSEQVFWAVDITQGISNTTPYTLTATLKKISSTAYLYLEKGRSVSDQTINNLAAAFDDMVPKMHDDFGSEMDVDSDPKITILLMDIRDGFNLLTHPQYIGGYFTPIDEMVDHSNSNKREMFYIDINPADPTSNETKGTLAHEFQHMIHYAYDKQEDTWFNEGLSDLATHLMGYGNNMVHVNNFVAAPDKDLTVWHNDLADYGAAYMFMLYLYEQYPSLNSTPLTRYLVSGQAHSVAGVNEALTNAGYGGNFDSVFRDWSVAVGVNDRSIDPRWGYTDLRYNIHIDQQNYWNSPIQIGGSSSPSPVSRHANDYVQVRFLNPLDYSKTFEAEFEGAIDAAFSLFEMQNNQVIQAGLYSSDMARGNLSFVPGLLGTTTFGVGRGDDAAASGKYTISIKPVHNIVFVIDDTGSMTNDIAGVKQTVNEKITELSANNNDLLYTLISFKDDVTYRGATSDPEVMKAMVNALVAYGGGDCPEAAFDALDEAAARVSGGDVWLMTDADAHGGITKAIDTAAKLVKAGLHTHIVSLGSCALSLGEKGSVCTSENEPGTQSPSESPDAPTSAYMELVADKTGGHYFQITTPQVGDALETSLQEMVSDGYLYWSPVTGSPIADSPVIIPVDEAITQTGFLLNTFTGINTLSLARPDGSIVVDGDPGLTHITTDSTDYYQIDQPTAGEWLAYVIGNGTGRLSVSAHTGISLSYIGNPSLAYNNPSTLKAYLPGEYSDLSFYMTDAISNTLTPVDLYDDGLHSDGNAADGIYAGSFTPDRLTIYYLGVQGTTDDTMTFNRTSPVELKVQTVDIKTSPIQYVLPGTVVTNTIEIANLGESDDSYYLTTSATMGWTDLSAIPYYINLASHSTVSFTLQTLVPEGATQSTGDLVTLTASSMIDPQISDSETFGAVSDPENLASPVIAALEPEKVYVGRRNFFLMVHGQNFLSDSTVYWDDVPLLTTFIDDTTLSAAVPDDFLTKIGQYPIWVKTASFGTVSDTPMLFEVTPAYVYMPLINQN